MNNTTYLSSRPQWLNILHLLRPRQWVKNCFVFLPMFFDGRITDLQSLAGGVVGFASFSLAASSVYCLNDVLDAEQDRAHPVKSARPIAAGILKKQVGVAVALACAVGAFLLCLLLPNWLAVLQAAGIVLLYLAINVLYCFKLKHIAVIDVFIIATGFVLRLLYGGVAGGVSLTHWIVLMTFLLALFLAFAKRRDDVGIYIQTGQAPRENVVRYNLAFMDQSLGIVATMTMMCYILFTVSPDVVSRFGSSYLYLTSVFVLAAIIRYLQLTIVDHLSGSPTKIVFGDRFIQLCIVGWILSFILIIYL
ncbi:MAG: decaprenyl-phosphate phosphoribosyltransferase [Prevotella sp.]|nr:decaprenyl-phosphate phosphoribosyltransferase [Prevotella sp.]